SASLFCVRWIKNTIRKVTIVVPVLMTSCHVSEKRKNGPDATQTTTVNSARPKPHDEPAHVVTCSESRASHAPMPPRLRFAMRSILPRRSWHGRERTQGGARRLVGRPPLRHEVAIRRGREVDAHGHVHAERLGPGADEVPHGAHTLRTFDQDHHV